MPAETRWAMPPYRGALLTDIQLRQVEAEPDKIPQSSFSDRRPAVLQQTAADRKQVVEELVNTRISGRSAWLPEG